MKRKNNLLIIGLGGMMAIGLSACSGDNSTRDDDYMQAPPQGSPVYEDVDRDIDYNNTDDYDENVRDNQGNVRGVPGDNSIDNTSGNTGINAYDSEKREEMSLDRTDSYNTAATPNQSGNTIDQDELDSRIESLKKDQEELLDKLDDFKFTTKEEWEKFRKELERDVNDLGRSIEDLEYRDQK